MAGMGSQVYLVLQVLREKMVVMVKRVRKETQALREQKAMLEVHLELLVRMDIMVLKVKKETWASLVQRVMLVALQGLLEMMEGEERKAKRGKLVLQE
jgi:hypothetical protein